MVEWTKGWRVIQWQERVCTKGYQEKEHYLVQYAIEDTFLAEIAHHPYLGLELTSDMSSGTNMENISC